MHLAELVRAVSDREDHYVPLVPLNRLQTLHKEAVEAVVSEVAVEMGVRPSSGFDSLFDQISLRFRKGDNAERELGSSRKVMDDPLCDLFGLDRIITARAPPVHAVNAIQLDSNIGGVDLRTGECDQAPVVESGVREGDDSRDDCGSANVGLATGTNRIL